MCRVATTGSDRINSSSGRRSREGEIRVLPLLRGFPVALRAAQWVRTTVMIIPGSPPRESSFAVRASVSSISRVKLHVSISAALMFEQPGAPAASIRHLIAVTL